MARRGRTNLKRRPYQKEPKRRFIIFCEGGKTEPAYFASLRTACSNALIKVETIAAAVVPLTLANTAVDNARALGLHRRSRKKLNSFEERDEVWAVFDRDEHPNFDEAVAVCESGRVGVARSNPCFELWLILHLKAYDKPDGRHVVQAHLQKLRPEYDKKGAKTPNCADLIEFILDAEQRAETQLTRREIEGAPYGPPSTTVGRLTLAIRRAAESSS